MELSLRALAEHVGAEVVGDPDCRVHGVSTLQNAEPGTISFLANRGYRRYLANTRASAVILKREDLEACPAPALVSENPYATYARVAALLYPRGEFAGGVHATAVVAGDASVADSAWVGPHCVIEGDVVLSEGAYVGPNCTVAQGVRIGPNTRLVAGVTICERTWIGANVLVHPGVVIGSDGFGIANEDGTWLKVPQIGRVRIEDDVEIGANTTIDRGALEDTVLEQGVKLDNQIQIAHNVRIGAHTAIAGCVGIAGSARIGQRCAIGGGVGVLGHLEIADDVSITAMSLVTKSIKEAGVYSSGTPLQRNEEWRRNFARFRVLDDMAKRIRELERKIARIEKPTGSE